MTGNNYTKCPLTNKQICKSTESGFSEATQRIFNELKNSDGIDTQESTRKYENREEKS